MRRGIQLLFLALFFYLVAITKWPPSDAILVDAFLSIDPLLSLQGVIASRTWMDSAFYGLLILLLTLFLGRFFCGYICPMGTCIELGDEIIYKKGKRRIWKNRERKLGTIKYIILIFILIVAIFGHGVAYLADPISWLTRISVYCFWPIIVAGVNISLDIFRPIFEAFGWIGLARISYSQPVFNSFGVVSMLFFILLIWLGRYQRRFWCRILCPLGAMLALFSRFSLMKRYVSDKCDKKGVCSKICQMGAIGDEFKKYDPGQCIACQECVKGCTEKVTSFKLSTANKVQSLPIDIGRRRVAGTLGAGIFCAAWLSFSPAKIVFSDLGLRPPGSITEGKFLATCIRCGQCVKACPTNCLQPSSFSTGAAGFMSPVAVMRIGACDQNCNACGYVCPTDAIRELDLDEKTYAKIGNAVIERERCVVWEQDRICLVCDEHCPFGAIYWKEVEQGERRPFVDENRCNGCGQCEESCPIAGSSAIKIYISGQIRLDEGSYLVQAKDRGLILKQKEDEIFYPESKNET